MQVVESKYIKRQPISKWTLFVTDKDYSEDELCVYFFKSGLRPATPDDLKEYMWTGWDGETDVTSFDSLHEYEGNECLAGIVDRRTVKNCFYHVRKPNIYKKNHWRFLLTSK